MIKFICSQSSKGKEINVNGQVWSVPANITLLLLTEIYVCDNMNNKDWYAYQYNVMLIVQQIHVISFSI